METSLETEDIETIFSFVKLCQHKVYQHGSHIPFLLCGALYSI